MSRGSMAILLFYTSNARNNTLTTSLFTTSLLTTTTTLDGVVIEPTQAQSAMEAIMNMKIPLIVMILLVVIVIVACCLCFMCYKLISCRDEDNQITRHEGESTDSAPIITIKSPKTAHSSLDKHITDDVAMMTDADNLPAPIPQIVPSRSTSIDIDIVHDIHPVPIIPNPSCAMVSLNNVPISHPHDSPSTVFITMDRATMQTPGKLRTTNEESPSTNLLNPMRRGVYETPSIINLSPGVSPGDDAFELQHSNSVVAVNGSEYYGTYASEGVQALTRDHAASESIKFSKFKKNSMHADSLDSKQKKRVRSIMDHMEEVLEYEMAKIVEEHDDEVAALEDEEDIESDSNDAELEDLMEEELDDLMDDEMAEMKDMHAGKRDTKGNDEIALQPDEFVVGSISTTFDRNRIFSTQL